MTKNRFAGVLQEIPLQFNTDSLTFSGYSPSQQILSSDDKISSTKSSSYYKTSLDKFRRKRRVANFKSSPSAVIQVSEEKSSNIVGSAQGAKPLRTKAKHTITFTQSDKRGTSATDAATPNSARMPLKAVAPILHDQMNGAQ